MGMEWWTEQAEGLRGRIESGEPWRGSLYLDGEYRVMTESCVLA